MFLRNLRRQMPAPPRAFYLHRKKNSTSSKAPLWNLLVVAIAGLALKSSRLGAPPFVAIEFPSRKFRHRFKNTRESRPPPDKHVRIWNISLKRNGAESVAPCCKQASGCYHAISFA